MEWISTQLPTLAHGYRAIVIVPVHLIVILHHIHMHVIVIVHGFVRVLAVLHVPAGNKIIGIK
jgi:hypothetical protein